MTVTDHKFGERRIYYNNFAEHLLNAYNPNMTYPDLPHRWSDEDWRRCIDMIGAFGFNVFEFWLVPRLFCREGLDSPFGIEYARQMNMVCDHAHRRGVKVEFIASLATVGSEWLTLCPNVPDDWREIRHLWDAWTKRLNGVDIIGIFPGDPGACSRNGCTALTYIDKSCEIAALIRANLPHAEIEFHTWGPPFFGWGNLECLPGWKGEFIQEAQHTAWDFSKERADTAMRHLLKRLPDFPENTSVAINLGFNSDGNPAGDQDARPWAREISRTNRILTWDFSLTEGENAVYPHYRFERLFAQRRLEREAAPYSGGICFTMTPRLNQLSLFESARSFLQPNGDHAAIAREYLDLVFGPGAGTMADDLPLFEIVPDWGNYSKIDIGRLEFHGRMKRLTEQAAGLRGRLASSIDVFPAPENCRAELEFFARLFADLSGTSPDYDSLYARYWQRVYAIYDQLPQHVDPRPQAATNKLINFFRDWKGGAAARGGPAPGEWAKSEETTE